MVLPVHWPPHWTAELIRHLWQSTVFAVGVWLLTLALRHNQARTRYRLWMLASAKFLVPFSILIAAGEQLQLRMDAHVARPAFSTLVEGFAQPFLASTAAVTPGIGISQAAVPVVSAGARHSGDVLALLMIGIWACGLLLLLARWAKSWWQLRVAVRHATPVNSVSGVPVLLSQTRIEPGVFGIARPVLVLPQGILERLSASQLDAILAHELCHVRRRDNLTAVLHMMVEALFWFHPVVWWIRVRLMEERERACDEAVLASRREALVYAEGILNVCKFYVEAPLNCVSGVTGSDLKKRIARIMTEHVTRKLDLSRKVLLMLAAVLAIGMPVTFGFVHAAEAQAQAAQKTGIDDTWQGTLHAPQKDLRIVTKITKTDAGALKIVTYSIDQGGQAIPASSASFQGGELKFTIEMIDGSYEGKMSADGKSIAGTWTQGPNPLPLVYERATPETEWAIPEPPKPQPPMAADANPSFEVATIKPSKPDEPGKAFLMHPDGQFTTVNTTMNDLIKFAYDVQEKQIIGGPDWLSSQKFDIAGKPDAPGRPNSNQLKVMVQKLLADRFQLKFHRDNKELSAYVLTVAKSGNKMKKSEGDPNGLPGLFFRQLGVLTVQNATMADFTGLMQAAVLDRPVVDQTGLQGRWDFILKWTPDESQFGGMGIKVPPPTDAADAPPPLFTAIQEQIGLKLEAGKAPVEVLVLDHVEQPSAN